MKLTVKVSRDEVIQILQEGIGKFLQRGIKGLTPISFDVFKEPDHEVCFEIGLNDGDDAEDAEP